ncbi:primosomal protein N' [Methylomarinum vadi]|uniref:primosomal protein N' n=1 Tax=Methylomarinum vadi TaxID=438855 RepID=UPI0004DF46C0|nr:primosomal protein N' [Methylomarinum vadi]
MAKLAVASKQICKIAVPMPLYRLFDYLLPDSIDPASLQIGIRVSVPFGKQKKTGVLLEVCQDSEVQTNRLKTIGKILDRQSLLSQPDLQLLFWASRYYHHPLGEVLAAAFPVALRKGKDAVIQQEKAYVLSPKGKLLKPEQLKRAPKQQAMLALFQQSPGPLDSATLKEWNDNWRGTLKGLLDKKLIMLAQDNEMIDTPVCRQAPLTANAQQQQAIDRIRSTLGQFSVFLLEGVTGSGKTEVYMQVIEQVLQQNRQILVLLPEITLTPQLEQRFLQRFAVPIVSSHSKLTDNQRLNAWLMMQQGKGGIMLGTRSALFTPMARPGLIVLDEEHDSSFKQQEGFRFSARDVAVVRARNLGIPIVLGSATPSLESLYNVSQQRYHLLHLPERAGNAIKPRFQMLDIRNKKIQDGLSESLVAEINKTLAKQEQVLLFLNRRGYAPVQMCHSCGYVSRCRRCDANLVIHYDENRLRCHHCGSEQGLIRQCPVCQSGELRAIGLGTERIEKTLAELFPGKTVVRLDRDTTQRKGTLEDYLQRINRGQADIIVGTQMLAKGHHFPNVTLVALLDVDSGLFSIDFHSAEKLAQMIVQVAGRAGRAEKEGRVILQTRQPDHPLLTTLLREGYRAFARSALAERHMAALPPYSHQALLRVQAPNAQAPQQFLLAVVECLKVLNNGKTLVLGPVAAPMARRAGQFRFQLLLQSVQRKELHNLLDRLLPEIEQIPERKKVRWSLDVDPVDLY